MDADDAGRGKRRALERGKEFLDEAHAEVVGECEALFDAIGDICCKITSIHCFPFSVSFSFETFLSHPLFILVSKEFKPPQAFLRDPWLSMNRSVNARQVNETVCLSRTGRLR